MTFFITNARAIAACDGFVDAFDVGGGANAVLKVYAGSVPADADAALGGATLLSEHNFSATAFGAAVDDTPGALATANAIADDTSANATGTASFFRCEDKAGTVVCQGGCATAGSELNFNTTSIQSGATVSITSFTVFMPES